MTDKELHSLAIGTKFYVVNGNWYGKIIENSHGEKVVYVSEINKIIPLNRFTGLDIKIIADKRSVKNENTNRTI